MDGLLVTHDASDVRPKVLAAMAAVALGLGKSTGTEVGMGEPREVITRCGGGPHRRLRGPRHPPARRARRRRPQPPPPPHPPGRPTTRRTPHHRVMTTPSLHREGPTPRPPAPRNPARPARPTLPLHGRQTTRS
nr:MULTISPECIES: hypothetical protein [unclassified Frankia]